jgi:hypothetical protein
MAMTVAGMARLRCIHGVTQYTSRKVPANQATNQPIIHGVAKHHRLREAIVTGRGLLLLLTHWAHRSEIRSRLRDRVGLPLWLFGFLFLSE